MNATIPLTIRNQSRRTVNMTLDMMLFCAEPPTPYKTKRENGKKVKQRSLNSTLHTMGFTMKGDGGDDLNTINLGPKSSTRVVIRATGVCPTIQTSPYYDWRIVWLQFKDADGKERPLSLEVSKSSRQLKVGFEPFFPMPDHYFRYQGGRETNIPEGLRFRESDFRK